METRWAYRHYPMTPHKVKYVGHLYPFSIDNEKWTYYVIGGWGVFGVVMISRSSARGQNLS